MHIKDGNNEYVNGKCIGFYLSDYHHDYYYYLLFLLLLLFYIIIITDIHD